MAKAVLPERKQTDEGLAVERAKADQTLTDREAAIEQKADVVIERAREEADDIVTAARAKADERQNEPLSPEQGQAVLAQERALADDTLRDERAEADELRRATRAANLSRLHPLERDNTDLYLLTERARSDDALANRDDFLGMVSHDLRDLLSGVAGNAALVAENTHDDERGKTSFLAAQRIQRSAARMARLIGDLLDIASIDAGKLAVDASPADAGAVVLEAIETWSPPALAKGIAVESGVVSPVHARFDNGRTLQVLGNLVSNAMKFSPRGAAIVVSVEAVEGDALFSVKDAGVGIPEDKLEAIFERFWQIGKNDRRGLGLGLYISKCLVEAHGGKIWAESVLGAGSTFFFTIPRES